MIDGLDDRRETRRLNLAGQRVARQGDHEEAGRLYAEALKIDRFASADDWALLEETPRTFRKRVQIRNLLRLRLESMSRAAADHHKASVTPPEWKPKVFVYWAQGFDKAPDMVKSCYAELLRLHEPDDIVTLTDENLAEWAEIPADVARKLETQNRTAFSDVLRFEILARHGGIWIDATCLPTVRLQDHFEALTEGAGFFAFDTKGLLFSSWFLAARPGSYLTHIVRDSLLLYWRVFDRPLMYYYLHHIFHFLHTLDVRADQLWSKVSKHNHDPRSLGRALTHKTEEVDLDLLMGASIVHKLSYKMEPDEVGPGTVAHEIVSRYLPRVVAV